MGSPSPQGLVLWVSASPSDGLWDLVFPRRGSVAGLSPVMCGSWSGTTRTAKIQKQELPRRSSWFWCHQPGQSLLIWGSLEFCQSWYHSSSWGVSRNVGWWRRSFTVRTGDSVFPVDKWNLAGRKEQRMLKMRDAFPTSVWDPGWERGELSGVLLSAPFLLIRCPW